MKHEAVNNYEVNDIGINLDIVKMAYVAQIYPVAVEPYYEPLPWYLSTLESIMFFILDWGIFIMIGTLGYSIICKVLSLKAKDDKKEKYKKSCRRWLIITYVPIVILVICLIAYRILHAWNV